MTPNPLKSPVRISTWLEQAIRDNPALGVALENRILDTPRDFKDMHEAKKHPDRAGIRTDGTHRRWTRITGGDSKAVPQQLVFYSTRDPLPSDLPIQNGTYWFNSTTGEMWGFQ